MTGLAEYPEQVREALCYMANLKPTFVKEAISQLMIRTGYRDLVESALADARALLSDVVRAD